MRPALLIEDGKAHLVFHKDKVTTYPYGTPNRWMFTMDEADYKQWIREEYERLEEDELLEGKGVHQHG